MSSGRCVANAPNRRLPGATWKSTTTPGAEPVEVEGFYRHMSDLGLRYGEEFRPIRELFAGVGQVSRSR